jgi:UDPglucose 6-dehydrogenase
VRRNAARLRFTSDPEELFSRARVAFVCVDTPPTASGDADLGRVHSVLDSLPASAAGAVLVMKSTVPAGTGRALRHALDERGLVDVAYASNPEFLREGTAVRDFAEPDRVVIGADDRTVVGRIAALYDPIAEHIVLTDVTSSEMIKLASNAFLATKISFINEVANVCEVVGATIDEVARGMGLDRRIGASFLRPGIGFGGSCFPKDVSALKQLAGNTGYHFQLLASVIEVNELQKRRVIGKLKHHLESLRDRRIALLGLAFKPDTNDMREASSVVLAARLLGEGAQVAAFDPAIDDPAKRGSLPRGVVLCSSSEEAATGADAVVIVTEWPEFAAPILDGRLGRVMQTPLIVDGRNLLDPDAVRAAGYTYEGVGRPARP